MIRLHSYRTNRTEILILQYGCSTRRFKFLTVDTDQRLSNWLPWSYTAVEWAAAKKCDICGLGAKWASEPNMVRSVVLLRLGTVVNLPGTKIPTWVQIIQVRLMARTPCPCPNMHTIRFSPHWGFPPREESTLALSSLVSVCLSLKFELTFYFPTSCRSVSLHVGPPVSCLPTLCGMACTLMLRPWNPTTPPPHRKTNCPLFSSWV